MNWLWPIRTGLTIFDVWSIAHLCFWVFIGSVLWPLQKATDVALYFCLILAILWEVFERSAERKWPSIWHSPESSINSLMDILLCAGGLLAMWYLLRKAVA